MNWRDGLSHRLVSGVAISTLWCLIGTGCSIRQIAIDNIAASLAASGDAFGTDDDPELIRDAAPFALKTMESLLESAPKHPVLLLAACRGFAEYSYAFIQTEADRIEPDDYHRSVELRERALRMFLRARDYGLRGLELHHPGITDELRLRPEEAVVSLRLEEIDFIYWTGAAWGLALAQGQDRADLLADSTAVVALMSRALTLDEAYEDGAIHEVMIDLTSIEQWGGSPERAREHFARAVELAEGKTASPYVSLAMSVSVPAQDRGEFMALLEKALEIDPDLDPPHRLANLIVQKRARLLLERVDDLFLQ